MVVEEQALFVLVHVQPQVAQQAAAEALQQPHQRAANGVAADDAHRFAVQIEAHEVVEPEVAAPQLLPGLAQLAVGASVRAHVYHTTFEQVPENTPDDERRLLLAALHSSMEGAIMTRHSTHP